MDKAKLFKKLKQKYVYLEEQGYDVLFLALQGSQNYGLDLDDKNYHSDIDCIAVILPSVEDIINSKPEVSTTIILDNEEHIAVKDIRQMFKMYQKQNVQFLETLFTDYKIINKKYKNELDKLFKMRDDITHINRKSLYYNIIGIALQKDKAFETKYDGTKDDIEKCGYSGKSLYHQIRVNAFIRDISVGRDFKTAMYVFDDETKEKCIKAKLCQYDYENAVMLNQMYLQDTLSYKEKVYEDDEDNETIVKRLNEIKAEILKIKFKEQLVEPRQEDYKLCPDHYRNVFITSDTHFGHANILNYEEARWRLCGKTQAQAIVEYCIENKLTISDDDWNKIKSEVNKKYIKIHDQELIKRWNNKVGKGDLVIICGDFSFRKAEDTEELLNQLNGDKVLIRGNHDIFLDDKKFNKSLFKGIFDYAEAKWKGQELCLMHYPIWSFKHQDRENGAVLLFGHIHTFRQEIPKRSFNVGTDVNNFEPVNIDDAIREALYNIGGIINGEVV